MTPGWKGGRKDLCLTMTRSRVEREAGAGVLLLSWGGDMGTEFGRAEGEEKIELMYLFPCQT